jgi:hypothetical protein
MAVFNKAATTVGAGLSNDSLNQGEPMGLPAGAVMAGDSALCISMIATVALNPGDAVLVDFANGQTNVTKTAAADSVLRLGIAVSSASIGGQVWVAVMGYAQAIAGAAIAQLAAVATSANAAGQVKTAAAAGAHAQLGWAIAAAAGAASVFPLFLDKA